MDILPDVPDPTLYAVPFFLVALAAEYGWTRRGGSPGSAYSDGLDTLASLGMGLGSILFVLPVTALVYAASGLLWTYRLTDLGEGALGFIVAMVAWDFAYYWNHRVEHEVRLLWACHVSHHSSRRYNFSTALRQPWTPYSSVLFYPPLAILGVSPRLVLFVGGLNLVYQFWVHTEVVDRLPRLLEFVFNTPSHHRVHHGSNPRYLDKNYGGILIIWDRMFGTFEPETEPVVYGLTKNIDTYNLGRIVLHEYLAIGRALWRSRSWREGLRVVFGPPSADGQTSR